MIRACARVGGTDIYGDFAGSGCPFCVVWECFASSFIEGYGARIGRVRKEERAKGTGRMKIPTMRAFSTSSLYLTPPMMRVCTACATMRVDAGHWARRCQQGGHCERHRLRHRHAPHCRHQVCTGTTIPQGPELR